MSPLFNFLVFFSLVVGGVLIEVFISQCYYFFTKKHYKKYHYSWGRYFYLLLFPFLAMLFIFSHVGFKVVNVFFAFAIIGLFLEWVAGFAFHKIVGKRLWTYSQYDINKYTSLLAIPLWGVVGVLFWLLAQVFFI